MDWKFRPYDEIFLNDNTSKRTSIVLKLNLKYKLTKWLDFDVLYQNEKQAIDTRNYQSDKTYYTRNLINTFTQYNDTTKVFKYNFPRGGILSTNSTTLVSNNFRVQLAGSKTFNRHRVNYIAGAEIRQTNTESYPRTAYGYNDEYGTSIAVVDYITFFPQTGGTGGTIPPLTNTVSATTQRWVSGYADLTYTYNDKYSVGLTGRRDGANIFCKNQQQDHAAWYCVSRMGYQQGKILPSELASLPQTALILWLQRKCL
ncbi:TonB-dependent receptor [Chitinophaga sedimenti]|uniref:TonB-dependent receptor n=1 Tax=Chitinophaga sedimenti TaxID=2033606 RepID=UPI002004E348|nr:TonB-dependent receptor [Chitinophaga sedimenti]MCK7559456.1 TonB-dependent receptor [Chitinophaga sedimenti]